MLGAIYAIAAIVLGAIFVALCINLRRQADRRAASILFHYSLAYLALLFCAMAIDSVV